MSEKTLKKTVKKTVKSTVKKTVKKTVPAAALNGMKKKEIVMEKTRNALSFTGKGLDLFGLLLKNMFLTMFTFGIYSFWAKINVQKFMNRNTRYCGESFDFHGTGEEKFIGFLKGMGIVFLISVGVFVAGFLVESVAGVDVGAAFQLVVMYLIIIALMPVIIVGKRRYFMSRSSWRGVRFLFAGRWKALAKIIIRDGFLSIITLGIYIPWFMYNYQSFMISNSAFGTEKFKFTGDKNTFIKICFKGFLFSILTLGIYSFWFSAEMERFIWNNTTLQEKQLSCDLTGGTLFSTALINMLLIIFTLGFGAAWALVRIRKVTLGSIALIGELDFEEIKAAFDEKASALADGVSDAGDALDSLADMIS